VEIVDIDILLKRCKNHRRDGGGRKLFKVNNGDAFSCSRTLGNYWGRSPLL
jgi:hypothetical protein